MSGRAFLRDKLWEMGIAALVCFFLEGILWSVGFPAAGMLVFAAVFLLGWGLCFALEFFRKRGFYNNAMSTLDGLDKKYLLAELLRRPSFAEGEAAWEMLAQTNKAMNDEVGVYRRNWQEYREYIEGWVHEVKTPLASARLIVENNRSELTERMEREIERVESYVEQVLYYAKSDDMYQDYVVAQCRIGDVVRGCLRWHARQLIEAGVAIELGNVEHMVYADRKWLDFIFGQIIANSLKYGAQHLCFSANKEEGGCVLAIGDDGMGIAPEELPAYLRRVLWGKMGGNLQGLACISAGSSVAR